MYKVLFVDDDEMLTTSFKRFFHKKFNTLVVNNPREALEILVKEDDIAVIIADMKMPNIDGMTLLNESRKLSPMTTRIMLTGEGDFNTAIRGINETDLFRFLIKPLPTDSLSSILDEAIEQYELNIAIFKDAEERKSDLISICSYCKKVKDPKKDSYDISNWEKLEIYFGKKYNIRFSHGICPDCVPKMFKKV